MSECDRSTHRHRDSGVTLPEVLIVVVVLGMIATVMSGALVMTLRQQPASLGRLNVARSEQSIGFYLPNDLASADPRVATNTDPSASPCAPDPGCPTAV